MVEKQVIKRDPFPPPLLQWDAHLTGDERPPAGVLFIHLITCQQIWIILQQNLQPLLRHVGVLAHRLQRTIFLQ